MSESNPVSPEHQEEESVLRTETLMPVPPIPRGDSGHTPAPWSVDSCSPQRGIHIVGANGNTVMIEEDAFVFPDEMKRGQREEIARELVANAQLIAAAPELLALVKRLDVGAPANWSHNGVTNGELRAAIAKAQGEPTPQSTGERSPTA